MAAPSEVSKATEAGLKAKNSNGHGQGGLYGGGDDEFEFNAPVNFGESRNDR
jgi:hypothetical protein